MPVIYPQHFENYCTVGFTIEQLDSLMRRLERAFNLAEIGECQSAANQIRGVHSILMDSWRHHNNSHPREPRVPQSVYGDNQ